MPTAVEICPSFNAYYYSSYVEGILEAFPGARFRFSANSFPRFASDKLAFIVRSDSVWNVIIDAIDRPHLDPEALAWSTVYGKVNRLPSEVPQDAARKVLAIGPGFPRRIGGPLVSWWRAIGNYVRSGNRLENVREHFANWRRQYKYALPEEAFQPQPSRDRYVFSSNSLWKNDMETNRQRASFFEACRAIDGLEFEGGFTPRKLGDVPDFDRYLAPRRYPIEEYVEKTKQSTVVFNTPAVFACHGFKLGEYLALGKAILSTPLERELPAPLEDGVHLRFVRSEDEIREEIARLVADRPYRAGLERGARAYYSDLLRPARIVERLVAAARAG